MACFLLDIYCFLIFLSVCEYIRYVFLRVCIGYINIVCTHMNKLHHIYIDIKKKISYKMLNPF